MRMRLERAIFLRGIIAAVMLLTACSFGPGNLQSKYSSDLESRRIKRIAVLPPAAQTAATTTAADGKSSDRQAAEVLSKYMYSALASLGDWQIVSEAEVQQALESVSNLTGATRLRRIGELVFADAVMIGRVERYRERVGDEWGVKSPASVAFVLDLIDVRRGDVI